VPELEWLEPARADLLSIIGYIADDNPDAAQHVKDDIESKVTRLQDFPKMGRPGRPGRVEGTRELVIWTNHVVVYDENAISVRILRVLHTAQQWPPSTE
jgi:addiction module RelE/StbE family toxin